MSGFHPTPIGLGSSSALKTIIDHMKPDSELLGLVGNQAALAMTKYTNSIIPTDKTELSDEDMQRVKEVVSQHELGDL